MKKYRKTLFFLFVLLACLVLHLLSRSPDWAETGYFRGFFLPFSLNLRRFWGDFHFSVGDIFYGIALLALVAWLIIIIYKLFFKGHPSKGRVALGLAYEFCLLSMAVYLVFNICWGINYNRRGIAWQLGLDTAEMTKEELVQINEMLLQKVNASRGLLDSMRMPAPDEKEIFEEINRSYKKLAVQHPFLRYDTASIKSSSFSGFLNYAGFTGYYNPFTGEAQVNTTVPAFLQPFTGCHEVAHQIGYAKEMEANFVGYLAARASGNPHFDYSAFLDLFLYANNDLRRVDSIRAISLRKRLSVPVQKDLAAWRKFRKDHETVFSVISDYFYDFFLKRNQQPDGLGSYARVTVLLNGYYKKYGKI